MRIGELADQSGVSVRALRYYEEHGLLHAERTTGQQRVYADDAIERVRLLRRLYSAGLTSTTIATLLPCVDSPSDTVTAEAIHTMRHEHDRLGAQITELMSARDQLAFLIDAAESYHPEVTSDAPDESRELARAAR